MRMNNYYNQELYFEIWGSDKVVMALEKYYS